MATAAVDAPPLVVAARNSPASHSLLCPAQSAEYYSNFIVKKSSWHVSAKLK
jgi:hypothetical protein